MPEAKTPRPAHRFGTGRNDGANQPSRKPDASPPDTEKTMRRPRSSALPGDPPHRPHGVSRPERFAGRRFPESPASPENVPPAPREQVKNWIKLYKFTTFFDKYMKVYLFVFNGVKRLYDVFGAHAGRLVSVVAELCEYLPGVLAQPRRGAGEVGRLA